MSQGNSRLKSEGISAWGQFTTKKWEHFSLRAIHTEWGRFIPDKFKLFNFMDLAVLDHQKKKFVLKNRKEQFWNEYFHCWINWASLSWIIFFVTCYGRPYCFQTKSFCFQTIGQASHVTVIQDGSTQEVTKTRTNIFEIDLFQIPILSLEFEKVCTILIATMTLCSLKFFFSF